MMIFAVLIAFVMVAAILSPFFMGQGGLLLESSFVNDKDTLQKQKKLLLDQYLKEEAGFTKGDLTESEWKRRREFFLMRYIDTVRRIDFLEKK